MKPTRQEIEQKVRDVLVEQLGVEPERVKSDAHFSEDLGGDSIDFVEVEIQLEHEFDIKIDDEGFFLCGTFGEMCDFIEKKLKK